MIIAVDPGAGGGWSWEFENKIYVKKMQETPKDLFLFLQDLAKEVDGFENIVAYVERVGAYVSGNSATAAVKFSRHCGNIEAFLLALNIPYHEILPNKWITYFIGKQKYPASMTSAQRKTKRKNLIKAKAQALYPHVKVTLAVSDALGLLSYGLHEER